MLFFFCGDEGWGVWKGQRTEPRKLEGNGNVHAKMYCGLGQDGVGRGSKMNLY